MQVLSTTNQLNQTQIYSFKNTNAEEKFVDINLTSKTPQKRKNTSAITIAAIAAACCALIFSRGAQKNINTFLNKTKNYLEEKKAHSTINESSKKTKIYENAIRNINLFIKKSESINNITSLKDILFMKLMYKTNPTKKIHSSITKYFESISLKTVTDSYEETAKDFNRMNKIFDELDAYILKNSPDEIVEINGKEYTKKQLVERARDYRESAKLTVDVFISKPTIQKRYEYINDVTSSLYSTFWNESFKDFWSKNNKFKRKEMWQTFIAAEQIRGNKTELAKWIALARDAITYDKTDRMNNVSEYIHAIDNILPVQDKEGIAIIKRLKCFAKNSEIFQNNKKLFLEELQKLKEHKILMNHSSMSETLEKYKETNIDLIYEQITDKKDGALQDMLSIYYKIAPFELENTGALMAVKKAVKSFDNSVNLESVEFFDKMRDLKLGSAPTDILTVLFSFVMLTYGLGHAKEKEERISLMLKSGIPVIGGVATMMYSAAKLVSGGKSILLGFLSGLVLNKLGIIADNIKQNRKIKDLSSLNSEV